MNSAVEKLGVIKHGLQSSRLGPSVEVVIRPGWLWPFVADQYELADLRAASGKIQARCRLDVDLGFSPGTVSTQAIPFSLVLASFRGSRCNPSATAP